MNNLFATSSYMPDQNKRYSQRASLSSHSYGSEMNEVQQTTPRPASQGSALDGYFYNPSQGNLKENQVIDEILNYISKKPEKFYDIIVGCDSSSGEEPNFPVAVVVLRVGEGGRFFLKKIRYNNRKFFNWKARILEEVLLSCQLALHLRENFEKKIKSFSKNFHYQFRYIHADISETGETREMIKEVTGLIRGNGFEPKIKPEAYVASNVADRYS